MCSGFPPASRSNLKNSITFMILDKSISGTPQLGLSKIIVDLMPLRSIGIGRVFLTHYSIRKSCGFSGTPLTYYICELNLVPSDRGLATPLRR